MNECTFLERNSYKHSFHDGDSTGGMSVKLFVRDRLERECWMAGVPELHTSGQYDQTIYADDI